MGERAEHPPTWGVVIRGLVDALRTHRADMHQTSNRPCSTCAKSAAALDAYEARRRYEDERRASRSVATEPNEHDGADQPRADVSRDGEQVSSGDVGPERTS